jgi:hypothetical protein
MRSVWTLLVATLLAGCGASHGAVESPAGRSPRASAAAVPTPQRAAAPAAARPGPDAPAPPRDPEVAALARAFEARLTVHTRRDGTRVLARRCREGPVPCRARLAAFAALIHETARRHGLDPYLLAALAVRESGLDPAALGRRREAGLVQLHPRGAGRDVRYVQDAGYRERCQSEVDACQGPVLERGASTLARAIEECGGLVAGLGAYASGRCTTGARHPRRVLEERDRLRELARERP